MEISSCNSCNLEAEVPYCRCVFLTSVCVYNPKTTEREYIVRSFEVAHRGILSIEQVSSFQVAFLVVRLMDCSECATSTHPECFIIWYDIMVISVPDIVLVSPCLIE